MRTRSTELFLTAILMSNAYEENGGRFLLHCFHFLLTVCSPALVAPDANIDVAARRIVWGKFTNSGQTCIAPDYVLCPADKRDRLIEACKKAIVEYYGEASESSYQEVCNFPEVMSLLSGLCVFFLPLKCVMCSLLKIVPKLYQCTSLK